MSSIDFRSTLCRSHNRMLMASLMAVVLGAALAEAQSPSVVITKRDADTQNLEFIGAVVDRDGSFVAVNQSNLTGINVLDYATATTIPFETSVLGLGQIIGGPLVDVPFGERANVLEDFFLNSNLQNPSVGTGILFEFADASGVPSGLINGPGADIIIFELSPPAGVVPPSGGPTVLGGDPFQLLDPATGEVVQVFADGFEQFGGNGFTGSTSFFTAADGPFTSVTELENGELAFVITVPGLNLYGTAVDLSDLGIAEGETVTMLQLQSIASTGFGPDFAFIAGVPGVDSAAPGIIDGVLALDAFGPFTEDFVLDVLSPQGGAPIFSGIRAPLFTSISVDASDLVSQVVTGDFLLDGSANLSPQASLVGDYLTDIIGAGLSAPVFASLLGVSDLGADNLEVALLQLSPEPHASAPVVIGAEQSDLYVRRISERFADVRREGIRPSESHFWADAFGALADRDADTGLGQSDFDPDLFGVILGLDYGVTNSLLVGGSIAYLAGDADFDTLQAESDTDTGAISLYALQTYGAFYAGATVGYGFGEVNADRAIVTADGVNEVSGDFDSDQFFTSIEIGWKTSYAGFTMEPSFETVFINTDRATFTEIGLPGLALDVTGAPVVNVLFLEPELDVSTKYEFAGVDWYPEVSVGYRFEVLNEDPEATASLVGAPEEFDFTVEGVGVSRGAVSVGTGLAASVTDRLTLSIDYTGLYDDDFTSHDLSLAARWRF